jgi:hypothetical protein
MIIFSKAKAGGFDSPIKSKRIQTKTNCFINEQGINVSDKLKKGKKRKVTKKHDLEYDSDEENLNQLKSKYYTGSKKMGNKKMKAVKNDEIKKTRIIIASDDSDSEDDEPNKESTCFEPAEKKATDSTLIYGKEIQLQAAHGQLQLNEKRREMKLRKLRNTLLNVKREKEDRSLATLNNIINNSNSTNFTSHDACTTTSSSIVNNNNNSTNTTTTSTNNSSNSNCNNTHNITFNVHDSAALNQSPGLLLRDYGDLFASRANMRLNVHQHESLGMVQVPFQQSSGMYHGHANPFLAHQH